MKIICEKCGCQITIQNYSRHLKRCDGSGLKVYIKSIPESLNCKYCNKLCKNINSLKQHECRCKNNPDRSDYSKLTTYVTKNIRGKTAQNCEQIKKQSETLKAKYENGYVNPQKGKKNNFNYINKEHNETEIEKWLIWLNNQVSEITIQYLSVCFCIEGYEFVKNVFKSETDDRMYITQQENIVRQIFGDNYKNIYVIHHINKKRNDNSISNLLLFTDESNHKRFHASKYAYLIYDEEKHLFKCELRK